jgi:hypothetical protein
MGDRDVFLQKTFDPGMRHLPRSSYRSGHGLIIHNCGLSDHPRPSKTASRWEQDLHNGVLQRVYPHDVDVLLHDVFRVRS